MKKFTIQVGIIYYKNKPIHVVGLSNEIYSIVQINDLKDENGNRIWIYKEENKDKLEYNYSCECEFKDIISKNSNPDLSIEAKNLELEEMGIKNLKSINY